MAASSSAFVYNTLKAPSIDGITGVLDINTGKAVASAATINLNTATGNRVHITGTTAITAVILTRGPRTVIFDGILTLTHNATTNNLPGAANITTAAGDRAIYESDGTTVYCVSYIKVSGAAVVAASAGFTLGTPVTLSGTSVTFTGIPAGTKIINICFVGVSAAGNSSMLIRIGDAGGIETTGYSSTAIYLTAAAMDATSGTTGFTSIAPDGSKVFSGIVTLALENATSFTWVESGVLSDPFSDATMIVGGSKSLSAELTQLSITCPDSFDAGQINIAYL